MVDDVLLNKTAIIERCLGRIDQEYKGHEQELETNFTRQDAIILNLLRVCEAAIGTAMHIVRLRHLGVPQESREAFTMLDDAGILDAKLAGHMRAMVGFRNIAIHNYQKINLEIVRSILDNRLNDFRQFTTTILQITND
ncbi:MAG TPA: DUF86 domain-containing protein [Acidiferrobacteraceae bacterium]|nr:DUF86 domain-containing protein [Acidiferrobacteraceae bacterium]